MILYNFLIIKLKKKAEKHDRNLSRLEDKTKKLDEKTKRREERLARKTDKECRKLERTERKRTHGGEYRSRRTYDNTLYYELGFTKDSFPADKKFLFVDGNNLMFLTAALRHATLRGPKGQAELVLQRAVEAFITSMEGRIEKTVLIFDNTSTNLEKTLPTSSTEVSLTVFSARPKFKTSDDALIAGAQADSIAAAASVYVTSDRALARSLSQLGGTLIKPKQFLGLACNLANGQGSDLDAWLASFLQ